jgi:hypothetical protein
MAVGVLIEKSVVKTISRSDGIFTDLPLSIMGPPVEESVINEWCKTHLDLLDKNALKIALFSAFQKTVKKNGYSLELQRINKSRVVRLSTGLIKEGLTIIKE